MPVRIASEWPAMQDTASTNAWLASLLDKTEATNDRLVNIILVAVVTLFSTVVSLCLTGAYDLISSGDVKGPTYILVGVIAGLTSFTAAVPGVLFADAMINRLRQIHRELARATDATTRSQARLEDAVTWAGAGAFEFDIDSGRTWFSESFRQLVGEVALERASEKPWRMFHPDDWDRARASWLAVFSDGADPSFMGRLDDRDGRTIYVDMRGHLMHDDQGRLMRVAGLLHDITALKAQEEALSRAHSDCCNREPSSGACPACLQRRRV